MENKIQYAIFGYSPDNTGGIYASPIEYHDTEKEALAALLTARDRMKERPGGYYHYLGNEMVMKHWPLFVAPCLK